MSVFDFIGEELQEIRDLGLFRKFRTIEGGVGSKVLIDGRELVNFCSNDYLGLSSNQSIIDKTLSILKKYGVGAGASRLVSGNFKVHEELESMISRLEGAKAAIVFPSGYMANLGTIQALVGEGDAVIIDRLDHASIVDGARLSGAKLLVYPHKDVGSLANVLEKAKEYRRRLVVSDHVFSMDGDIAPVKELEELAKQYDAMLMLDVAHSTGVIDTHFGEETITMGTLSKAAGSLGGFVAGSSDLIDFLRNRARSFIYTTGLPPAIAAAALASMDIIYTDSSYKQALWNNVYYLKKGLLSLGLDIGGSETQIIPVMIGDAKKAVEASELLFENGLLLSAIRPPTVPKGTSRLRLTVTASHSKSDIDLLLKNLKPVKENYIV